MYKIEQWRTEFGSTFYVAFTRVGRFRPKWREIFRCSTKTEAEKALKNLIKPVAGPWFYTKEELETLK